MNKTVKLRLFLVFAVLIFLSVFRAGTVETDGIVSDVQIRDDYFLSDTGENLNNPSFTGGITSWTGSGDSTWSYDSSDYQDTAGSAYWPSSGGGAQDAYLVNDDYDDFLATDTVTFSCYYMVDESDLGSGSTVGTLRIQIAEESTPTSWTTIQTLYSLLSADVSWTSTGDIDVSASFGTGSYRLRFWIYTDPSSNGYHRLNIDNCHLTGSGGGTDYEKDLTETVTVADVKDTAVSYDRAFTDSVSASDVKTIATDFARNLIESIGVVGIISVAKLSTKDMIETISVSDVRDTAVAYARNLSESTSISDIISRTIGLNMTEAISVLETIEASKAIALGMFESISVSDTSDNAVSYVRNLTESISAIDAQSNAAVYVRDFVEAITVSDVRDIVKGGGVDYEKDLTEEIAVVDDLVSPEITINGSMFYQLFFSLNMWGYLGPIALVIVGYIASKKDRFIGLVFIIVKSLIIAIYLTLVTATPGYWWHVFILILGVILITGSSLSDG